jgi:alpha-beta hydrolase superfamily lysophospholipase
MAEHSARYRRLAEALTARGYAIYADDHRGHGQTCPSRESLGHFADADGWNKLVDDQTVITEEIQGRHPNLPVFLLGHSMGSYIARAVAIRHGARYRGLLLSGTSYDPPGLVKLLRVVASLEGLRLGKTGKSALLRKLTFEAFNKTIADPRTTCDWLSRDKAEVDKYIADPFCGFACTNQLWWDLSGGLLEIGSVANIAKMPKDLPIYVLAGEHDPINNKLSGIKRLRKALEKAGMKSVTVRVYQEARHELFNETNREEVTHDLVEWLDRQLA